MILKTIPKKMRSALFTVLFILLMASTGIAATYYVDKNSGQASDSNSGTENSPFKTFQRGVDKAVAGDTVYVKAGTYYEYINLKNSGKAGAPITFKRYMNDVVTLDGSQSSGEAVVHWNPSKDYIVWDGINITKGSKRSIWIKGNYNIIQNSEFSYNGNWQSGQAGHSGVTITETDHIIFRNNEIHHAGWNGVNVQYSNNATVEHNIAHDNTHHFGIQLYQTYGTSRQMWSNNNMRYNVIYNNDNGAYLVNQQDNVVSDNLIYNNDFDGIKITSSTSGVNPFVANTLIANNTIAGNGLNGINNEEASHLTIMNNIFYSNTKAGIRHQVTTGHKIDNNLYNKNGSIGSESNPLTSDPLFVNVAGADYSLKEGSPAIDAGADLTDTFNMQAKDLEGVVRPQATGFDIGAYEYGDGSATLSAPKNLRIQN